MAIFRKAPTCPFCGKPIARAIYKEQKNVPIHELFIGDTFEQWEYFNHFCEKMEQNLKKIKKANSPPSDKE